MHLSFGLTVEGPVLGIQRGLNGMSCFPNQAFKLLAAQIRQRLLHGNGAAGVTLWACAKMFACKFNGKIIRFKKSFYLSYGTKDANYSNNIIYQAP